MISRKTKMVRKAALKRKTTLRKKKRGGIDVELDKLVRQIILLRDGFRCVWCLKDSVGHGGKAVVLQAAHVLPKGAYPALRHELSNVITLCWHCHMIRWHRNPADAMTWFVYKYGQSYVDRLRFMAQTRSKVDKQALKLYLKGLIAS